MPDPELIALVTCDATAVDPAGKVTLYGLFDVIWTTRFPARHGQLSIFCKCRFAAPGTARVVIERPDGEILLGFEPFQASQAGSAQVIYNLSGVEFPVEGAYRIRLLGADGPVGMTLLEVRTRQ